jgi:hypothetical protein
MGVSVGMGVADGMGVRVGSGVNVCVGVKVRVSDGVSVGRSVSVGTGVADGMGVREGVHVRLGVRLGVSVSVGVGVNVFDGVNVRLGVSECVRVGLGVSVGLGVVEGVNVHVGSGVREAVDVAVTVGSEASVGSTISGVRGAQAAAAPMTSRLITTRAAAFSPVRADGVSEVERMILRFMCSVLETRPPRWLHGVIILTLAGACQPATQPPLDEAALPTLRVLPTVTVGSTLTGTAGSTLTVTVGRAPTVILDPEPSATPRTLSPVYTPTTAGTVGRAPTVMLDPEPSATPRTLSPVYTPTTAATATPVPATVTPATATPAPVPATATPAPATAAALWQPLAVPDQTATADPTLLAQVAAWAAQPDARTLGLSALGRPIAVRTLGTGPVRVLVVGGIHGGWEANTVALVFGLYAALARDPAAIPPGAAVAFIPAANPDGLVLGRSPAGRFNGRGVDLNRNWACAWSAEAVWRDTPVNPGPRAMSEPETAALAAYLGDVRPAAALFYHSAAGGVFAGQCGGGLDSAVMAATYGNAAGYPYGVPFSAYAVTGTAADWAAGEGIAAADIELFTRDDAEIAPNLRGLLAVLGWAAG